MRQCSDTRGKRQPRLTRHGVAAFSASLEMLPRDVFPRGSSQGIDVTCMVDAMATRRCQANSTWQLLVEMALHAADVM